MTEVGSEERMTDDQGRWVRRYRSAPDAPVRLVCLPHAGGAASYYRPMASRLLPEVELLAVQYPGRQDRAGEPCVVDFAELTERVAEAVRPSVDRPVALFGHSMGSWLAFEVARRLEADGTAPLVLFASGRRPPGQHHGKEPSFTGTDDEMVAELAALNGTEARLLDSEEMRRMFLPALRGDFQALRTYRHEPGHRLACPVVALTGDSDDRVSVDGAAGWAGHTTGAFDLTVFPGGHFYLNDQWDDVVAVLKRHVAAHVAVGTG